MRATQRGFVLDLHLDLVLVLVLVLVLGLGLVPETISSSRSTSTGETPEYEYEYDQKILQKAAFAIQTGAVQLSSEIKQRDFGVSAFCGDGGVQICSSNSNQSHLR